MSQASDWIWGTLTSAQLAFAGSVAKRMLDNVKAMNLPQIRGSHTPDERYQKLLGAEGEVAFYVLTGRVLPTVDAMTNTWKGPDVDGYAVKTIGRPGYRLLFDDSDLSASEFVLILNQAPRFAIVGRINTVDAVQVRHWANDLPRPTWAIRQRDLQPWGS